MHGNPPFPFMRGYNRRMRRFVVVLAAVAVAGAADDVAPGLTIKLWVAPEPLLTDMDEVLAAGAEAASAECGGVAEQ